MTQCPLQAIGIFVCGSELDRVLAIWLSPFNGMGQHANKLALDGMSANTKIPAAYPRVYEPQDVPLVLREEPAVDLKNPPNVHRF
jgi:hypothetical protein